MKKIEKKKKLFSSKSTCDHSAPVSFPFWPFFMCGVCYPNPGAPLHPGTFIFVSLRQCSSHLLLSASTHFIVRVLSACVICTLPQLGIAFHSSSFCFSWLLFRAAFYLLSSRTRYASTWFGYLDSLTRLGFSLSHCLWPQNLYLSTMKNQEGHWGYCWCWVEEQTV